jgi:hypothetical protein
MKTAIGFWPFWLFGVLFVLFPSAVLRFYAWLHGPRMPKTSPRQVRNAGLVWLAFIAIVFWLT